jgi:hypothetical protein
MTDPTRRTISVVLEGDLLERFEREFQAQAARVRPPARVTRHGLCLHLVGVGLLGAVMTVSVSGDQRPSHSDGD